MPAAVTIRNSSGKRSSLIAASWQDREDEPLKCRVPQRGNQTENVTPTRSWLASIGLRFARTTGGRTELVDLRHSGPLRVQRLFYPDPDGKAHCYLLHPPGGIVPGDELGIDVDVTSGAALLTTPSAGRFYDTGTTGARQWQRLHLRVRDGALLEWLPQETLLFSGACATLDTQIDLDPAAALAFWDILVLGRPASGQRFERGAVQQRLLLRVAGVPVLDERLALSAGDRLQRSRAGLAGHSTVGTALFRHALSREAREAWLARPGSAGDGAGFAITQRGEFLVARYLGEDAARCRAGFSDLWQRVQALSRGSRPSEPRIWHT